MRISLICITPSGAHVLVVTPPNDVNAVATWYRRRTLGRLPFGTDGKNGELVFLLIIGMLMS
jgi:hypothetical protein